MGTLGTTLTVVGAVIAVFVVVWLYVNITTRSTRLKILKTRVGIMRGSLLEALDRRVEVARRIAAATGDDAILAAADAAAQAGPEDREARENRLSAALAAGVGPSGAGCDLPGDLTAELRDAQFRIMAARRFYNDAVRDTRTLTDRRLVRWLRLDRRAPRPDYFEIADSL